MLSLGKLSLICALSLSVVVAEDYNGYNDYYGENYNNNYNNAANYDYNAYNYGDDYNNNAAAGDDAAVAGDDAGNAGDDAGNDGGENGYDGYNNYGDDGMQSYGNNNFQDDYLNGEDYIEYWTDYAILPKRCITYNNVDVIVFSMFEHQYKQCGDTPMGTYITSVPQFVQGHLQQEAQDNQDQGYGDFETPAAAQYLECTPVMSQSGSYYYYQLGCADGTSQALAVNLYSDNTCETRYTAAGEGNDDVDVSVDVTALEINFKKCKACVNWFDNNNAVDDQYYTIHQTQAPYCSTAWAYKETCGRKCQHTGMEKKERDGWNTSDQVLLAILAAFGLIMVGLIAHKRQKMSNKDSLLEQAAMSAAGLQQPHVIGLFILVVLVIAVFALLGLKNITWTLLLLINTILFGYLMKLTVDSGVSASDTLIGPDGTILRRDSDDSSMESSREDNNRRTGGTFVLPTLA